MLIFCRQLERRIFTSWESEHIPDILRYLQTPHTTPMCLSLEVLRFLGPATLLLPLRLVFLKEEVLLGVPNRSILRQCQREWIKNLQ